LVNESVTSVAKVAPGWFGMRAQQLLHVEAGLRAKKILA
jgi:hypothetical protein